MSDQFVAEICIFPYNFAPLGWATCDGQILPISQNTALFSLLGTTYGGDGKSNFALPNLAGAFPMHPGQGPGLSLHDLGEQGGTPNVTLIASELPAHSHALNADPNAVMADLVNGSSIGPSPALPFRSGPTNATMSPFALQVAGNNFPHNNMPPYMALTFCIALQGIFPPR